MDNEPPDPLAVAVNNDNGLKLNILVQLQTSMLKFQSQLSNITSRLSLLESDQHDLFNELRSLKSNLSTTEPQQGHGHGHGSIIYEAVNRLEGRVDSLDNQMCIIQQHFQALTLTNNHVGRDDNVVVVHNVNVHGMDLDQQPQNYEEVNFGEEEVEVNGLNIVKLEAEVNDNYVEADDFYQFIGPTEPYDDHDYKPDPPASSSSSDPGPDDMIPVPSKRTLRRRNRYGKSIPNSANAITKSKESFFVDNLRNRVSYSISGRKVKCPAPACRLNFPGVSTLKHHYNMKHARSDSIEMVSHTNETEYKEFEDRLGNRVTYAVSEGRIQKCPAPACKTRMNFPWLSQLIYHYNTRHVRQNLSRCRICGDILQKGELEEHELSHQDQD